MLLTVDPICRHIGGGNDVPRLANRHLSGTRPRPPPRRGLRRSSGGSRTSTSRSTSASTSAATSSASIPTPTSRSGPVAYWGVPNADEAYAQLIAAGATEHSKVQDVGDGIRVASLRDSGRRTSSGSSRTRTSSSPDRPRCADSPALPGGLHRRCGGGRGAPGLRRKRPRTARRSGPPPPHRRATRLDHRSRVVLRPHRPRRSRCLRPSMAQRAARPQSDRSPSPDGYRHRYLHRLRRDRSRAQNQPPPRPRPGHRRRPPSSRLRRRKRRRCLRRRPLHLSARKPRRCRRPDRRRRPVRPNARTAAPPTGHVHLRAPPLVRRRPRRHRHPPPSNPRSSPLPTQRGRPAPGTRRKPGKPPGSGVERSRLYRPAGPRDEDGDTRGIEATLGRSPD